ncbi:MAG: TIM barrel protein [Anaerolineae bacterium]|nr:TIM barrel protein [Anaerolineae bacterium]
MFNLSVCADTVFLELPFEQRVQEISKAGFMVEFWGWQGRDIDGIAADPQVCVGIINGSGRGSIVHPDLAQTFLEDIEQILEVAKKLRLKTLNLLAGQLDNAGKALHPISLHPATTWITAYETLCRVAELAEKHDVVYNLENLNTKVDHAGYPLPLVEDTARLVEQVGSPRIKILLDIYHAAIEEGNVIELIRTFKDYLGYIHVADVPGRHEPGTGELNYANIAKALRDIGYTGTIGLEAFPERDSQQAMARFREIFA